MTERQVTDQSDFETEAPKSEGMGGIGADFVATLGRRVADARTLLPTLTRGEGNAANLAELRRKLHAVSAGAKLLKFDIMASSLGEALAIVDRASGGGVTGAKPTLIAEKDAALLGQILDDLPALAWSESRTARRKSQSGRDSAAIEKFDDVVLPLDTELPYTSLVVGGQSLVDALGDDTGSTRASFECERSDDVQVAIDRARSLAPDVIVLDADVKDAELFLEALADDEVTEPVPLIVVGTFARPGDAERFVAMGASRTFEKPLIRGTLRRACERAIATREGKTERLPLGEPTMTELAERLSQEVKQALLADVDGARNCKVPLGDGAEVIGAMWGAIARIREVVTARTDGVVRFSGQGPEGAIALAPWLHGDVARSDRSTRARGASPEVRLHGRRVVVADDDPGVTWFLADLLRAAGCTVHEAMDGRAALELAFRVQPDLVISDILMPGMDGFALCRAMKRDVALRDTPVVLLSWKEDLLQRVRELGASAAAYMRKESDSRAIVARVREVLKSRARVEARLRAEDEVRGRLDGLTVRSLLEIVCGSRRSARISLRDASFLYEVEVREGVPFRASRASADGSFVRGEIALAHALGIGAGRFTVEPSRSEVARDLKGTLSELLAPALARARAATMVTTGAALTKVERIQIDDDALDAYLRATPEPSRGWVARIASGTSPRALLLEGAVDPTLLDDLLSDLATRGSIAAVQGEGGIDLLTPAVERIGRVMRGEESLRPAGKRSLIPFRSPTPSPPDVSSDDEMAADALEGEGALESAGNEGDDDVAGAAAFRDRLDISPSPVIALARKIDAHTPAYGSVGAAASGHASADETDVDDAPVGFWEGDEMSIPVTVDPSQPSKRLSVTTAPRAATTRGATKTAKAANAAPAEPVSTTIPGLKKRSSRGWPIVIALALATGLGVYAYDSMSTSPLPSGAAAKVAPETP
jgi:CheY-like chemotaxis protein